MASLSHQEMYMFAQYYGDKDLPNNDKFWDEVLLVYKNALIPLPLADTTGNRRKIHLMLECPDGCCECCHYNTVPIDTNDLKRISNFSPKILLNEDKSMHLDTAGGCQFLKECRCSIYPTRPEVCFQYPFQTSRDSVQANGEHVHQLCYRVGCEAAVKVIRQLMKELDPGYFMLPDLSWVNADVKLVPVLDDTNKIKFVYRKVPNENDILDRIKKEAAKRDSIGDKEVGVVGSKS
jgi:Fe-S-cluster containining protein